MRRLSRLLAVMLLLGAPAALAIDLWQKPADAVDQVPAANQVFRLLPPEWHDGRLRLEWDIAPGYYLYRDRIRVSADGQAQSLALPEGSLHHDEHFGDLQIYRGDLVGSLVPPPTAHALRVSFQGCADAGICYPPQQLDIVIPRPDARSP